MRFPDVLFKKISLIPGICVLLCSAVLASAETPTADAISIQVSWVYAALGKVELTTQPSGTSTPCEAAHNILQDAISIAREDKLEVKILKKNGHVAHTVTLDIPKSGHRFILILAGEKPETTAAWLIPGELSEFPWGSSYLINRSVNLLRFSVNGQSCEVPAGNAKINPFIATGRKMSHFLVEYQKDGKWKADCSTQIILSEVMRAMMIVGPGDARQSQLLKTSILDYRHDRPASGTAPAVSSATEAKPPESQPAK